MADYLPQNSGNWSTTTWITAFSNLTALAGGNTPPTVIDDVYADGKTITININTAVNSIRTTTTPRTGGLAGGGFTLNNSISLSANVLAGSTVCLTFSQNLGNSCTVYGNLTGGSLATSANAFSNTSTGTASIFGDVRAGGSGNAYGVGNTSSGIVNIVGTVRAGFGSSGDNPHGVNNSATGTVNITGGIIGGTGSTGNQIGLVNSGNATVVGYALGTAGTNYNGISNSGTLTLIGDVSGGAAGVGIAHSGTGTVTIIGTVVGGSGGAGVTNSSTGIINLSGTAIGGIGAVGINNSSTGTVFATRVIGNGFGLGSAGIAAGQVGLANSQNGRAYVEQAEFGSRGFTPISGPIYIFPSNRNTLVGYTTALGTPVTFYNSLSVSGLLPPTSSVRLGTVYNVGNSTGTMAVPSASAVQFGVPVDNTVGTAALQPQDVWGYARLSATQVDSMGDRLRNTATTQSIGYQIASFNL